MTGRNSPRRAAPAPCRAAPASASSPSISKRSSPTRARSASSRSTPETYMGDGGPPHRRLRGDPRPLFRCRLHGVGLSIGSPRPLGPPATSARLKGLIRRYQPAQFSEYLAWSSHERRLPRRLAAAAYDDETLAVVCRHIDETQETLATRMLCSRTRRPTCSSATARSPRLSSSPRSSAAPAAACARRQQRLRQRDQPRLRSLRLSRGVPALAMSARSISPATPTRSTTKRRRC